MGHLCSLLMTLTYLICYDDDHTQVKDFLCSDLDSLARSIATSKMQINVDI